MAGNTFGRMFEITTFGESHGKAVGVVIDGIPPNIHIDIKEIQRELDRRKPGQSSITTRRKESDKVEIISGIFEGKSTGTPMTLLVRNRGFVSSDYEEIKDLYRPGHADYTYEAKYGIRDWRGGGRSSGRETIGRVAAGAVAKLILKNNGVSIVGYSLEIAGIRAKTINLNEIEKNIVRSPDLKTAEIMIKEIEKARKNGDSVGGIVETIIKGCPPGLGDPVFNKLDAMLSYAIMSIGGIKGVEIGRGFNCSKMRGSEYNDEFYYDGKNIRTRTNNAGGILGGISTGEPIVIRAAVRPPASISIPQKTLNIHNEEKVIEVHGRHDPCVVPRVIPVVEAMVAVTLLDCLLIQKAYSN